MTARLHVAEAFASGSTLRLPALAARHVQVLRLQPGDPVALFNGIDGADWAATITRIGRGTVEVRVGAATAADRELADAVTIAVGVPSGDRMDALVEKAGELGAAAIQPLVCERSVVRLAGERAAARRRHWAAVAAAASEQCGRTRIAEILPVQTFADWLEAAAQSDSTARKFVLAFSPTTVSPECALAGDERQAQCVAGMPRSIAGMPIVVLSGPEGGLTPAEEDAAVARGFIRVGLGARVLRADTAPIAMLSWLALRAVSDGPKGIE